MRRALFGSSLVLCLLCSSTFAFAQAQATSGTIQGFVKDESGESCRAPTSRFATSRPARPASR